LDATEPNHAKPFVLVQLSDPHIGAEWGLAEPKPALITAVDAIRSLPDPPDALLVSGDLADTAADDEYEFVCEVLAELDAPVYVLPGNHDDPARLREHFEFAADHVADLGPLRLILLDSTTPGQDSGELTSRQLGWLEDALAADPDKPALVALHHPPFATGIPSADAIGIAAGDRRAFAEVVARHPQLLRITSGHVHRAITGEFAGRSVMSAPSTFAPLRLNFHSPEMEIAAEPAGFAIHALVGDELVSHIHPVT
jgi:3',5'-cyclic AMP phosphodiesterase CpdA